MIYTNEEEIFRQPIISEDNGTIRVHNAELFRTQAADNLAATITLSGSQALRRYVSWIAHEAAIDLGAVPSSIHDLYAAMGRGETPSFTVPAMNIRTLTYDTCRMIFRSANEVNSGAFIFEIAKSEIGYTYQRPQEYTAMILLAAIREGYRGPVFIQGDHFQLNPQRYLNDRNTELDSLKKLIVEAINAGYYNIDIDSSTLVDLSQENVDHQQRLNCEACAELTKFIRQIQPAGLTISIGGEIGEVGSHNSTAEELDAFMRCYTGQISGIQGISKLTIQTGTTHGGVVLPDGTIAKVKLDFETLKNLSSLARKKYQMAGCVQHGASTLPNEAFHNFPEVGCAEIHLATQFQNIVYDYMPIPLKEKIYAWLHENFAHEKPGQTVDQFIYKTRKNALGPFKKEITALSYDVRSKIVSALKVEFDFLFNQLKTVNTKPIVDKYTKIVPLRKNKELFMAEKGGV
jgi:fructose/tagatose bisphosphate aldolase